MASSAHDFVRRFNPDGTTDSICTKCFFTIATATWEADLDSAERDHKCDLWRLDDLRKSVNKFDATGESTGQAALKRALVS